MLSYVRKQVFMTFLSKSMVLAATSSRELSTKMLHSARFSCNLKICLSASTSKIKFFLVQYCFLLTTLSFFILNTCESIPVHCKKLKLRVDHVGYVSCMTPFSINQCYLLQ